jgi:hypothetical protein
VAEEESQAAQKALGRQVGQAWRHHRGKCRLQYLVPCRWGYLHDKDKDKDIQARIEEAAEFFLLNKPLEEFAVPEWTRGERNPREDGSFSVKIRLTPEIVDALVGIEVCREKGRPGERLVYREFLLLAPIRQQCPGDHSPHRGSVESARLALYQTLSRRASPLLPFATVVLEQRQIKRSTMDVAVWS